MLRGLQVEHELAERSLQPGQLAFERHEPGAGHPRGGLEVHQAERLAQLDVVLGRVQPPGGQGRRIAEAVGLDLDIAVFVGAGGHAIGGQVGQAGQAFLQFRADPALRLETRGDVALQRFDLEHQPLGLVLVLAAFGLTDLLGGLVAARLGVLQGGLDGPQFRIQSEHVADHPRRVGQVTQRPAADIGVRVVANGLDVMHGRLAGALGSATL